MVEEVFAPYGFCRLCVIINVNDDDFRHWLLTFDSDMLIILFEFPVVFGLWLMKT